jgi:aspartate 1-decarboxylase
MFVVQTSGSKGNQDTMKLRIICKSKIHHAVVTASDANYIGSIGIDQRLMAMTDIVPGEQVLVWNLNNGCRITTYAIPLGDAGQVVVNGAAARHFLVGDVVIIAAFTLTDEKVVPKMIALTDQNRFWKELCHPDVESEPLPKPELSLRL